MIRVESALLKPTPGCPSFKRTSHQIFQALLCFPLVPWGFPHGTTGKTSCLKVQQKQSIHLMRRLFFSDTRPPIFLIRRDTKIVRSNFSVPFHKFRWYIGRMKVMLVEHHKMWNPFPLESFNGYLLLFFGRSDFFLRNCWNLFDLKQGEIWPSRTGHFLNELPNSIRWPNADRLISAPRSINSCPLEVLGM